MDTNPEYLAYARKINFIGNRLLATSNKFTNNDMDTDKELKNRCLEGISEYKDIKVTLMLAVVPNIVKEEHKELIDTVQEFITGTDYMLNATGEINPISIVNNEKMIVEGRKLQIHAGKEVPIIVEKICKKFGI